MNAATLATAATTTTTTAITAIRTIILKTMTTSMFAIVTTT